LAIAYFGGGFIELYSVTYIATVPYLIPAALFALASQVVASRGNWHTVVRATVIAALLLAATAVEVLSVSALPIIELGQLLTITTPFLGLWYLLRLGSKRRWWAGLEGRCWQIGVILTYLALVPVFYFGPTLLRLR
jgi:hypothetical protein